MLHLLVAYIIHGCLAISLMVLKSRLFVSSLRSLYFYKLLREINRIENCLLSTSAVRFFNRFIGSDWEENSDQKRFENVVSLNRKI